MKSNVAFNQAVFNWQITSEVYGLHHSTVALEDEPEWNHASSKRGSS